MNLLHNAPADLLRRLENATLEQTHEGMSGTSVFRVEHQHQPDEYLKIAAPRTEQDMHPELCRLLWLQGRLPVPEVRYWADDDTRQYLLISAIPGLVLYHDDLRDQLPALIRLYATALRQIHAVGECPFDARLDVKIAQASRRVREGAVDTSNFDEERQGRTPQSVFRELIATRPPDEHLVFTHGDYCTPNLLVDPETLALNGLIDWGRAGMADRYQDIALAARSIEYNFGIAWVAPFYEAYGLTEIDHAKVKFYRLLDEFF